MAELLVIESGLKQAETIRRILAEEGHHCTICQTIPEAEKQLRAYRRTMTILNAQLPWAESSIFLRSLEKRGLPVLFIDADQENLMHLKAMYQSRSDALAHNASPQALLQAVRALLCPEQHTLTIGSLCMNLDTHTVTKDGRPLTLTAQEFALLHVLMVSPGAPLTREDLLRTAWGYQGIGVTRTVDVHVQRLRRKLGSGCIETIYKTGYRLRMA